MCDLLSKDWYRFIIGFVNNVIKPLSRNQIAAEAYNRHLLDQWLDRQVDMNWATLSGQCSQALSSGRCLSDLNAKLSVLLVREDGVDQAKFKCPRKLVKGHAWDRLIRPALHVQGIWAHGFGFHFAVADADMPKNTNSNVEAFARMLESIYNRHKGMLPRTVTWQMDNCSRECKNSKILKFCTKLVVLGVFEHCNLAYPVKGHSHGPLDATFGQCCVKMGNSEFDDPSQVVDILQQFLDTASFEHGTREGSQAYKMDQAADWETWWEEIQLDMSNLTGPEAPHWFHICSRKDLSPSETNAPYTAWPGAPASHPDDIVVAVKDRMASICSHQVALLVPGLELPSMRLNMTEQPHGHYDRKKISDKDVNHIVSMAVSVHQLGALSDRGLAFLRGWATSKARRNPRPIQYKFLQHRAGVAASQPQARQQFPAPCWLAEPRKIIVHQPKDQRGGGLGEALPLCQRGDEEDDQEEYVIQRDAD